MQRPMGMGPPMGMTGAMMMGPVGDFGPVRRSQAACAQRELLTARRAAQ